MNQELLSPIQREELIIHSFSTLRKLKLCLDTIFVNEDLSLSTNRFEPHNYYHLSNDLINPKTSFFIVLEAISHKNPLIAYHLNYLPLLGDISSFKPESQSCVQWLCKNFSIDNQRFEDFIFTKNNKIFLESFIEILNTPVSLKLSFKETLELSINSLSPILIAMNQLDINELNSWIATYFVWEEKQKIHEALGSEVVREEASKEIKGKRDFKI